MTMTSRNEQRPLELVELALQYMWRGEVDAAIETYDQAMAVAEGEEVRELITIRKAEALIAADREGPEVTALPSIVMRRRTPRHVYLAAGMLMRRHVEGDDRRKAIFYGEIACAAAAEMDDSFAHAAISMHLGITLVADSQFQAGVTMFDSALAELAVAEGDPERIALTTAAVKANLGGAKVLMGDTLAGVAILEASIDQLVDPYDRAEAYLDLCFANLELGNHDAAERFGRTALELACVDRQIRNANHLLGELCVRTDRYDEADRFFDVVAGYYPEFKNVKQLLVAVDLCSVVNWKA